MRDETLNPISSLPVVEVLLENGVLEFVNPTLSTLGLALSSFLADP